MRGTGIDPNNRMIMSAIAPYPKPTDVQVESKSLHDLMTEIDEYLGSLHQLIETNRLRTCLKLLAEDTASAQ
jgi:hypothetical protein